MNGHIYTIKLTTTCFLVSTKVNHYGTRFLDGISLVLLVRCRDMNRMGVGPYLLDEPIHHRNSIVPVKRIPKSKTISMVIYVLCLIWNTPPGFVMFSFDILHAHANSIVLSGHSRLNRGCEGIG